MKILIDYKREQTVISVKKEISGKFTFDAFRYSIHSPKNECQEPGWRTNSYVQVKNDVTLSLWQNLENSEQGRAGC
jgi:hypothetical protein